MRYWDLTVPLEPARLICDDWISFYLDLELTWQAKTYVRASEVPPGVGVGVLGLGPSSR